ncbi:MAG: formylmethanofuran dehydrogenase [Candidatus Abyssobacteria bacterium SURF_17]|uniref:Formylmethanofuran dehydrogenase n=1 Tax=Candidatus Abyssobacteria bacterium SURF_17 TaxID=2093361 RepID=A0A419EZJ0_9BACT|nr:MAG: formylmethanofuran dehydrogenase [Candidatus Abyssubacteria bacterium SURF_17]
MTAQNSLPSFEEAARFHGHICPGLAIGYRVATTAMHLLGVARPHDEELVAVVENDTCAVDAIQVVTGCTFGKGNLVFKDYGKGGFSFFSRDRGKAIRVRYREFPFLPDAEGERMEQLKRKVHFENSATEAERQEYGKLREKLIQHILSGSAEDFLAWRPVSEEPPSPARIRPSITCENCGEQVMQTRIRKVGGQNLCIPCSESPS